MPSRASVLHKGKIMIMFNTCKALQQGDRNTAGATRPACLLCSDPSSIRNETGHNCGQSSSGQWLGVRTWLVFAPRGRLFFFLVLLG